MGNISRGPQCSINVVQLLRTLSLIKTPVMRLLDIRPECVAISEQRYSGLCPETLVVHNLPQAMTT